MKLRPYQESALCAIRSELSVQRSTLAVLACGLGKAVLAARLAREWADNGERTLVLAHRTELLEQLEKKLRAAGLRKLSWEKGARRAKQTPVVLASVATLRGRRLSAYAGDSFDNIICDEAQHACARGHLDIFAHFPKARILGLTATPDRHDGQSLAQVFSGVAYRYDLAQATEDRWLCPLVGQRVLIPSLDLSRVRSRHGDLDPMDLATVMERADAVQAIAYETIARVGKRRTIVFAASVAHARELASALAIQGTGAGSGYVVGDMTAGERKSTLESFARGRIQYLVNVDVCTEGTDIPAISAVVIARPTQSLPLATQMIGRATRRYGRKRNSLVLDFVGPTTAHRLADVADVLAGRMLDESANEKMDRRLRGAKSSTILVSNHMDACYAWVSQADEIVSQWMIFGIGRLVGVPDEFRAHELGLAATSDQLDTSRELGVPAPIPVGLTTKDAAILLGHLAERKARGLCSLAQSVRLSNAGVDDPSRLTASRAAELLAIHETAGGVRWSLHGQPEAATAKAAWDEIYA